MPVPEYHHGIDGDRREQLRQLRNEGRDLSQEVEQRLLQRRAGHQRQVGSVVVVLHELACKQWTPGCHPRTEHVHRPSHRARCRVSRDRCGDRADHLELVRETSRQQFP